MEKGQGRWTRLLRRGVAIFLTTVTVWVLSLTADMGAAAETFRTLAESPAFVSAALRAELGGGWQMVVANIVADVIKGLSPLVRPMLAPGGWFLCSGIIDDRAEEVADCLRVNGWEIVETRSAEGWFSYLCR